MTSEELIKQIKAYQETKARNSMGCSENWYDYVYAIKEIFTLEEIEEMKQNEIDNLIRLANNIQDGLY